MTGNMAIEVEGLVMKQCSRIQQDKGNNSASFGIIIAMDDKSHERF